MNKLIYKLFKLNFYENDVVFGKDLIDQITKTKTEEDLFELHKMLDSKLSTQLGGDAIYINRCINKCKEDLKDLKKLMK